MSISVGSISSDRISTGTISEEVLGPELQSNFDMSQGVAEWTAAGVTLQAVDDAGNDAVLITAIDGTADRGEMAISGLVIGRTYRLSVIARRGAQGTNQQILAATWGSHPTMSIDTQGYQAYNLDIEATSTSGVTRVYAAQFGSAGDEVYVSQLSIREIL